MVAVARPRYVTPQEYLVWERRAETRSEYHDGIIVAMAGASWEHGVITGNAVRHLGNALEETPCATIPQDLRVRVPECNKYYYPDVVVVCGEPQFEDTEHDTLLNPTLIVEVLSPSTERKDRGEKFDCYQTLDSFTTYVLVSQEEPRVECFMRQSDDQWLYQRAVGLDASLTLPSIGCTLRLADLYARITFPSPDAPDSTENVSPPTT
jgi:Uma2 family endonuclease